MKFHIDRAPAGQNATQLWLMLPGAYMKPADFIQAGFADAVRERGLPHDIALLEATITDMADGSALLFLQDFLRQDAAASGRRVSLLGISLGGHLALACLAGTFSGAAQATAASRIASACLLAPYLGPRDIVADVAASGTLEHWLPAPIAPSDLNRSIWLWLQRARAQTCDLYLGYGADDRFANAHALMGQALPASHIDVMPGGHAWPVWTALWQRHLDKMYVGR